MTGRSFTKQRARATTGIEAYSPSPGIVALAEVPLPRIVMP